VNPLDVFEYLDKLQKSGEVNMCGAAHLVAARFGVCTGEASALIGFWMEMRNVLDNHGPCKEGTSVGVSQSEPTEITIKI
jgi:hypothetical protein